jgi:hypothetical protein
MFMDPKVTRTFNYYIEIEAQLADIKETSLSTINMGDLFQVRTRSHLPGRLGPSLPRY